MHVRDGSFAISDTPRSCQVHHLGGQLLQERVIYLGFTSRDERIHLVKVDNVGITSAQNSKVDRGGSDRCHNVVHSRRNAHATQVLGAQLQLERGLNSGARHLIHPGLQMRRP